MAGCSAFPLVVNCVTCKSLKGARGGVWRRVSVYMPPTTAKAKTAAMVASPPRCRLTNAMTTCESDEGACALTDGGAAVLAAFSERALTLGSGCEIGRAHVLTPVTVKSRMP